MIRKTEEDYHRLAESRGFKWVGGVLPKNVCYKTWWECGKGHRWLSKYNDIDNTYGCPYCAGNAKKTERDYHILAKSRGFKWVGGVLPKNTSYKTLWKCDKNHEWVSSYAGLCGCPVCNRRTADDYNKLAKSRGFKWIGKELPKNIQTKTCWECHRGHRWKAQYNSIYNGTGCPFCGNRVPKTEKDYHSLAKTRGFVWVGVGLPKNTMVKTKWRCKKRHEWRATYNNISKGTRCPCCGDRVNGVPVSKPQRRLSTLLYGSLNYPESRYRIDVAIIRSSQKIAVEYDCYYWHKEKKEHDTKRDKYLIKKGWKVLHIKSSKLVPTRKQLTNAIGYLLKTDNSVHNVYLEDWK